GTGPRPNDGCRQTTPRSSAYTRRLYSASTPPWRQQTNGAANSASECKGATMVKVSNLIKTFPDRRDRVRAVDQIDFEVPEGKFYTLLGPSGCGKTTTLRCIAGLERPD